MYIMNNIRQVVLDIETSGLDHKQGHRIIKLTAIELIGRKKTGRHYCQYINPECEIYPDQLQKIGISADFLLDKPRFVDIASSFVDFISDAELIIHNAPFEIGFLNAEFTLAGLPALKNCVIDTLKIARKLHSGKKNSLYALCDRYCIDKSHHTLHGKQLDVELLAEVFYAMACGKNFTYEISLVSG